MTIIELILLHCTSKILRKGEGVEYLETPELGKLLDKFRSFKRLGILNGSYNGANAVPLHLQGSSGKGKE